jgi:hypothetical protein
MFRSRGFELREKLAIPENRGEFVTSHRNLIIPAFDQLKSREILSNLRCFSKKFKVSRKN